MPSPIVLIDPLATTTAFSEAVLHYALATGVGLRCLMSSLDAWTADTPATSRGGSGPSHRLTAWARAAGRPLAHTAVAAVLAGIIVASLAPQLPPLAAGIVADLPLTA
ncbi:hypothetical protein [Belnapia sp. F-4-1]|uniref:hypothetical protein n=1 Tax=Belnapia sp. F-4-1 TaxID=1545443 RepID=UPI0005BCAE6E|nr:hypothetical protein [Belnapia sp. F-4-1]